MIFFAVFIAVVFSALCAWRISPVHTFHLEWLAFLGWGLLALHLAFSKPPRMAQITVGLRISVFVFAVTLYLSMLLSCWHGFADRQTMLIEAGYVSAAIYCAILGFRFACDIRLHKVFLGAVLLAGVLNAVVGGVQLFAPQAIDGVWVLAPRQLGRAVGNLGQPNHLATMLLWAMSACVAFIALRWLNQQLGLILLACLTMGLVWSGSRTGMLGLLVLAFVWFFCRTPSGDDLKWSWRLIALFAVVQMGTLLWAHHGGLYYGHVRAAQVGGDVSSGRGDLWATVLRLWLQNPVMGLGWGQFRHEWALTPIPGKPTGGYGHTHNLFLQWLVELGLLRAGILVAALFYWLYKLWQVWKNKWRHAGESAHVLATAYLVCSLTVLLHSMLEFPLWYSYFLLPTAWMAGGLTAWMSGDDLTASSNAPVEKRTSAPWLFSSLLMVGLIIWALSDYQKVMVDRTGAHQTPILYRGWVDITRSYGSDPENDEKTYINALKTRPDPFVLNLLAANACKNRKYDLFVYFHARAKEAAPRLGSGNPIKLATACLDHIQANEASELNRPWSSQWREQLR